MQQVIARLSQLKQVPIDQLLEQRYQRYRKLGVYLEQSEPASV
jgi:acetyl-CoA carboxylase alpha subunit